jgi:hypothetical protein
MNELTQTAVVSMTTVEIAERTGKRHDHVMRDTRNMLTELYGEGGLPRFGESYKHPQNSQTYPMYRLPKHECLVLIAGYSIPLRSAIIKRLEELEAGITPNPVAILPQEANRRIAKADLDLHLYIHEELEISNVSKLALTHSVLKRHAVPTDLLPAYVEQTPVTFAAKDLLKQNNVGISSIAFNKLMMGTGLLEERDRTGSKGKIKKYKALTKQGLAYGQNDTSPHNPREVQPHYYADKFPELMSVLGVKNERTYTDRNGKHDHNGDRRENREET